MKTLATLLNQQDNDAGCPHLKLSPNSDDRSLAQQLETISRLDGNRHRHGTSLFLKHEARIRHGSQAMDEVVIWLVTTAMRALATRLWRSLINNRCLA